MMNEITKDITSITQYNIRYGLSGSWVIYGGLYCNFTTNHYGLRVTKYTQSTINQLKQGFNNLINQYPGYHEQVYFSNKTKAYQWYLDYLYKSTGMHLYLPYAPKLSSNNSIYPRS